MNFKPRAIIAFAAQDCPAQQKILEADFKKIIIPETVSGRWDEKAAEWCRSLGLNGQENDLIFLEKYPGSMLKKCPGTKYYRCCNYHVINQSFGCPLGCSYCFLNTYDNIKRKIIYSNVSDLFMELDRAANRPLRIGTGELTDSLVFDHISGFSLLMDEYLQSRKGLPLTIEYKTKTVNTVNLPRLKIKEKIIIGWSLNSRRNVARHENGTPLIEERIKAAAEMQSAGFLIALHFDPMIYYSDWKNGYREVLDMVFTCLDPRRIAYISAGALRYAPQMTEHLPARIQADFLADMFLHPDGKMRYYKSIREEMYKLVFNEAGQHGVYCYLCMENNYMWKKISPHDTGCGSQKIKIFNGGFIHESSDCL